MEKFKFSPPVDVEHGVVVALSIHGAHVSMQLTAGRAGSTAHMVQVQPSVAVRKRLLMLQVAWLPLPSGQNERQ